MTYVFDCDQRHDLSFAELKRLLGGKAANLAVMALDLGLPVPPAFTITTAACNEYLAGGWPDGLDDELRAHMARMEERVGRRFGDPGDPLLVSVRSGAPISMPGMMDTILNLGLNDATTDGPRGAARASPKFAANCRAPLRRDVPRHRRRRRRPGGPVGPSCARAVEAVFRSWNSDRARAYREHEGIPDDLGTARDGPGDGVRQPQRRLRDRASSSPATPRPASHALYGDVMFNAQGEDVVAGTHRTEPISVLDERMPDVARELRALRGAPRAPLPATCATSSSPSSTAGSGCSSAGSASAAPRPRSGSPSTWPRIPAFPLTREEAVRRVVGDPGGPADDRRPSAATPVRSLATGPAGLAGRGLRRDRHLARRRGGGRRGRAGPSILVRAETSPDDVHGMARAAGILTSTGGLASHAAVVARGWGIPAVVGAAGVVARRGERHDRRRGRWPIGDDDHDRRQHRRGVRRARSPAPPRSCPRRRSLLAWARELGIAIGAPEQAARAGRRRRRPPAAPGPAPRRRASTPDDVLRALARQGLRRRPRRVATALLCTGRRGQRAPGPARRRRPGRDGRRLVPAHRRRQGRGRASGSPPTPSAWGVEPAPPPPSTRSWRSTTG